MDAKCEHGAPSSGCVDCLLEGRHAYAYAQGRADERAAIVAWLREDGPSIWCNVHMTRAADIERGEHVDARKEEP